VSDLEYDYDYDQYTETGQRRLIVGYLRGVGGLLAVLAAVLMVAAFHQPSPASGKFIDWSHQDNVPLASWDTMDIESSGQLATTIDRLYAERQNSDDAWFSVAIPKNQRVVVVARVNPLIYSVGTPYTLAYVGEGVFAQTCVIEKGGILDLIGDDSGRSLFSYSAPDFTTAPFDEKCSGGELLFEKVG